MDIYRGKSRAELLECRSELENGIKIIDSELESLRWIEIQGNIKKMPDMIDRRDLDQILLVQILADRFMAFDVGGYMRESQIELSGSARSGYSLREIRRAFELYHSHFG